MVYSDSISSSTDISLDSGDNAGQVVTSNFPFPPQLMPHNLEKFKLLISASFKEVYNVYFFWFSLMVSSVFCSVFV